MAHHIFKRATMLSTGITGLIVDLLPNTATGNPVTAWASTSDDATVDVGTIENSPAASAGGGVEFNGTNQAMLLSGTTANFQASTETGRFTLAMLLDPDDINGAQETYLQTKAAQRGLFVGTSGAGGLRVRFFNSSNATLWTHDVSFATCGVSNGTPFDLVVVGDGTNSKLYVNGTLRDTQTVSTQAGVHEYAGTVGRYTTSGGYYDGSINAIIYASAANDVAAIRARMGRS